MQIRVVSNNETQIATPNEQGFIGEVELLKRLPISRGTLFNYRKAGRIPAVVIGRRVLFHWPSVEAALLRQQREATA